MKSKNITIALESPRISSPRCIRVTIEVSHYGLVVDEFGSTGNDHLDRSLKLARKQCWGEFPYDLSDVAAGVVLSNWLLKAEQNFGNDINLAKIS